MPNHPVIIVPARTASSRLPNKPLADIAGKPMIVRTLDCALSACSANGFEQDQVIAAVDSSGLAELVQKAGYRAVITDPDLPSGSDRICAVADMLNLSDETILVNLQGDEPAMPKEPILRVVDLLYSDPVADWATLACAGSDKDNNNPDVVKLVRDRNDHALYFSRSPIPYIRKTITDHVKKTDDLINIEYQKNSLITCLRHIGLYAYRAGALRKVTAAPPCMLEQLEGLEQLRALYLGQKIRVGLWPHALPHGVDTQQDLDDMRKLRWPD